MDRTHTSLRHKNWGVWGGGNKSPVQLCEGRHHRCSGSPLPFSPTVTTSRSTRRGVPLVPRVCALRAPPGSHPPGAPLTDDDGAGAHQPDLLLERHPLRGSGAGSGAGGGRGRWAGVPAPARLLRVAGHVSVPPLPRSLHCQVCPTGRQSVGPPVCPYACRPRSPDSAHRRAHALARGPGGGPQEAGAREGRKEGWQAAPSPTFLKGNSPRTPPQSWPGRVGREVGADLGRTSQLLQGRTLPLPQLHSLMG